LGSDMRDSIKVADPSEEELHPDCDQQETEDPGHCVDARLTYDPSQRHAESDQGNDRSPDSH